MLFCRTQRKRVSVKERVAIQVTKGTVSVMRTRTSPLTLPTGLLLPLLLPLHLPQSLPPPEVCSPTNPIKKRAAAQAKQVSIYLVQIMSIIN